MSLKDENPADEIRDDQILASILSRKLQLSLKVIASAQALAWHDLPMNEKRTYMAAAEQALRKEMAS